MDYLVRQFSGVLLILIIYFGVMVLRSHGNGRMLNLLVEFFTI